MWTLSALSHLRQFFIRFGVPVVSCPPFSSPPFSLRGKVHRVQFQSPQKERAMHEMLQVVDERRMPLREQDKSLRQDSKRSSTKRELPHASALMNCSRLN